MEWVPLKTECWWNHIKVKINVWPLEIFHPDLEVEKEKWRETEWSLRQTGGGIDAQVFWLQVWTFISVSKGSSNVGSQIQHEPNYTLNQE